MLKTIHPFNILMMCEVVRKGFPKIILDNEEVFLQHLYGIIDSVDELSTVQITRSPFKINFRIAPSVPRYAQMILREILKLNTIYGITLDLSKSMRTTSTIAFSIEM